MGITNKVCDFFGFWYYQYILVTALYMLEAWERALFSILRGFRTISLTFFLLINYVSALAHFLTVIIVCWGG